MLERKWLGDKTKGGFYKKQESPMARSESGARLEDAGISSARRGPSFPALEMAKTVDEPARAAATCCWRRRRTRPSIFLWSALSDLWTYSANRIGEIADSVVEIDRAMKLGFNWEMGPFELWDAAGVAKTVERMKMEGKPVSPNVEKLLASGKRAGTPTIPRPPADALTSICAAATISPKKFPPGVWSVTVAKKSNCVVKKNAGASLVDLGDGVGCIEFHSKMNALGGDIVQMITQTLKPGGAGDNFDAFVITNDAANFSVGANIMMLLMAVQEEEWDEVDLAIRAVPEHDPGHQVLAEAGGGRAVRHDAGRRLRDHAARARLASRTPNSTWDWSKSASACCPAAAAARR